MFFLVSGASPTRRDLGRGFTAAQWSHYCGRHICAESIEKFVRTALPNGGNSTNQTNNLSGITSSGNTSGKISRQNKEKKKKNNNRQVFLGKMYWIIDEESKKPSFKTGLNYSPHPTRTHPPICAVNVHASTKLLATSLKSVVFYPTKLKLVLETI